MRVRVLEWVAQNLPRDIDSYPAGGIFSAYGKGRFETAIKKPRTYPRPKLV